jgi:hypothetical protein
MRLVFFVPALLAINGCSSYKYQQAKGNYSEMWNRGYAEQPLEATNSWRVRYSLLASRNDDTRQHESAKNFLLWRASELCMTGFTISEVEVKNYNMTADASNVYTIASAIIECNSGPET